MTDDIILGMHRKYGNQAGEIAKQIKMRQLTVSQNHIKKEFKKIAKDEFNVDLCTSTVHTMLCKQEFGHFKVMPFDYTLSQGFEGHRTVKDRE